jgi:hypothetical protein
MCVRSTGAGCWDAKLCSEAWDRNGRPALLPVSWGPGCNRPWCGKAKALAKTLGGPCTCGYAIILRRTSDWNN